MFSNVTKKQSYAGEHYVNSLFVKLNMFSVFRTTFKLRRKTEGIRLVFLNMEFSVFLGQW